MTIENPQNSIERSLKLQTIDDIKFELVGEDDPDFEKSLTVINTNGKRSERELLEDAEKVIIEQNWWLQEYWQKRGVPREQISVKTDNLVLELYNYGQELNPSQAEDLKRVIGALSRASIPEQNKRIKYIAITNQDELNDQNGENKRGYAFPSSKMVALYPRAVSPEPHRIPNTSSFAGTLAHEFGHIYLSADSDFWNDWRRNFGWKTLPDDQVDWSKAAPKRYSTNQPERCITDYALFSPDEDICESLSAVVNNPEVLDTERRVFVRERWLKEVESKEVEVDLEKKVGNDIQLPKVPDTVKYRAKVMNFSFGAIKQVHKSKIEI